MKKYVSLLLITAFLFAAHCIPVQASAGGAKSVDIPISLRTEIMGSENTESSITVAFDTGVFFLNASQYNHSTALLSMAMSAAAYGQSSNQRSGSYIASAYEKLELSNIFLGNYAFEKSFASRGITVYQDPSWSSEKPDTVGFSFGHRQIASGADKYNLIVITLMGTYGKEWYSNFNMGTSSEDHAGFKAAKDKVAEQLSKYISSAGLTVAEENKILITGHSRGAAVANLLAAQLTQNQLFADKKNIFAYTFATPNVTSSESVKNRGAYDNIFNIISTQDFIAYMPLSGIGWDYCRYGKSLVLPGQGTNPEYTSVYKNKMNDSFKSLTNGKDYLSYGLDGWGAMHNLAGYFLALSPTVDDFYNKQYYVTGLRKSFTVSRYFDILCSVLVNGDLTSKLTLLALGKDPNFGQVSNYLAKNDGAGLAYAHAPETYLAWMLATDESLGDFYDVTGKLIEVSGPVDVTVYDQNGSTAISVTNGNIVKTAGCEAEASIDGGAVNIYLPAYGEYKILLTGTVSGSMGFSVSDTDIATTLITPEKRFVNVSVTPAKKIQYTVTLNDKGTVLYVTDEEGKVTKRILPDGTEQQYASSVGDVDGDGGIKLKDATLIQAHLAKLKMLTQTQLASADVDKDGVIRLRDVTLIQKHLAKLIDLYKL